MRGAPPRTWSAAGARLAVAATLLLPVLLAPVALAQTLGPSGFELERLELNPDGQGSLAVGSGLLLPEGALRVSLAGHYERNPLVFYRDGVRQGSVVKDRVMAHVLAAWAPLRWLEVGAQLPIIAYQRGDDLSGQGHLCAAGVVFLTLVRTRRVLAERQPSVEPVNLMQMLDLVALATVCDVVPLLGVNRAFVRRGLDVIAGGANLGLAALGRVSRLSERMNAYHLGFLLDCAT